MAVGLQQPEGETAARIPCGASDLELPDGLSTIADLIGCSASFKLGLRLHRNSQRPDHAQIAGPDALAEYDGIVLGAPTRFGRMPSQMAAFWDTCGGLWMRGALTGKVAAVFTSTASQHGGQETTLFSMITNLLHFGCTIVGLDYGFAGQNGVGEVKGGAPYGATTIADNDGSRQPSQTELDGARYLGNRVAVTAAKLIA